MNKLSCNVTRDLMPLYVDGVLSQETAQEVRRHLDTCEKCRAEHDRMAGILPLPVSLEVQQESARPLRRLKKKVTVTLSVLAVLAVALAVGAWYLSQKYTLQNMDDPYGPYVDGDDEPQTWRDGLATNSLAPGEELVSDYQVTLEEGQVFYYAMNWNRMFLVMQVGLRAPDGTEYASEPIAGGSDHNKLTPPAGTYRLFIRHAGDYTGVPSYEDPENFPEISYNVFCVMNYAIA